MPQLLVRAGLRPSSSNGVETDCTVQTPVRLLGSRYPSVMGSDRAGDSLNPQAILGGLRKLPMFPRTTSVERDRALRAWDTIRKRRTEKLVKNNVPLDRFAFSPALKNVVTGTYTLRAPLIKKSALTTVENGGVGKYLSDGWALNYAIGCTHACRFCYVDSIHKVYGRPRAGNMVMQAWGNYFAVPRDMEQLIEETPWSRWQGKEVMMSSMHDPYLPQLVGVTRKILEAALPAGVNFCIQTRSPLASRDFTLLQQYRDQVRLQVSIATLSPELARVIEPRVAPPRGRFELLRKAKNAGLRVGVILAPILPPVPQRQLPIEDLGNMMAWLAEIKPDLVFGECIHRRGSNMGELELVLGSKLGLDGFDLKMERAFYRQLAHHHLEGKWWREFH